MRATPPTRPTHRALSSPQHRQPTRYLWEMGVQPKPSTSFPQARAELAELESYGPLAGAGAPTPTPSASSASQAMPTMNWDSTPSCSPPTLVDEPDWGQPPDGGEPNMATSAPLPLRSSEFPTALDRIERLRPLCQFDGSYDFEGACAHCGSLECISLSRSVLSLTFPRSRLTTKREAHLHEHHAAQTRFAPQRNRHGRQGRTCRWRPGGARGHRWASALSCLSLIHT